MREAASIITFTQKDAGAFRPLRKSRVPASGDRSRRINQGANMGRGATARKGTNFVGVHFQPTKLSEKQGSAEIIPIIAHVPAKVLANFTDRSVETAKGWKSGRAFLNGASLINLARSFPEVRNWVIEQCGGDTGPNAAALIGSAILKLASQSTPQGELARQALQLVGGGE